ncbi:MAG: hypothetical protein Ct9H300mP11_30370 [Chloroflexota bacterium]|nr:MAG: hypothetical protein Ct9H300mP11_30370 [Chloroflexota bacterium]
MGTVVSSRGVGLQDFSLEEPWRPPSIVLEVDPPYHTKTRTVIEQALSPAAVRNLTKSFREDAEKLFGELLERGTFDAVGELAEIYPTTVFPKAVGLQTIDRRRLIDYGEMVFSAIGPDNELRRNACQRALMWFLGSWSNASANISPDGFGSAIYAGADAGEISVEEAGLLVRSLCQPGSILRSQL